jgi:hypothetical protein
MEHMTILAELARLPEDLNSTYDRILNQIDEVLANHAAAALKWLLLPARPLFIEELVEASNMSAGRVPLLESGQIRLTERSLSNMLHDLVAIEPPVHEAEDIKRRVHTVVLAHFSVQEFLTSDNISNKSYKIEKGDAHLLMARGCLSYLYHYNRWVERAQKHPLREYSWYNWEHHVCPTSEVTKDRIRRKAARLYRLLSPRQKDTNDRSRSSPAKLGKLLVNNTTYRRPQFTMEVAEEASEQESRELKLAIEWIPPDGLEILREALNIPFFYPDFDLFGGYGEEMIQPYKFEPLDYSKRQIRLLTLLPSLDAKAEIKCRLHVASLNDRVSYDAISYTWGDYEGSEDIKLEASKMRVRANLASILHRLKYRQELRSQNIWVDALCLDQGNMDEMRAQVNIMGEIFHCANEVVIGLGPGRKADERGITYLTQLTSAFFQTVQTDSLDSKAIFRALVLSIDEIPNSWAAIAGLFDSPWWQRCWVILEIVRSTNATILYGTLSLNFNVIEQAAKSITNIETVLRENVGLSQSFRQWTNHEGWQAALRMSTTKTEYRLGRRSQLPILLWRFAKHNVSNPRDRVYSLLGLFPSENEDLVLLQTDYKLPLQDFFMRVAAYILNSSRSLDILSYHSAFSKDYTTEGECLPSWTTDFRILSGATPLTLGVFDGLPSMAIFSAGGMNTVPNYDVDFESSILQLTGRPFGYIINSLTRYHAVSKEFSIGLELPIAAKHNHSKIPHVWWTLLAQVSKFGIEILGNYWGNEALQKVKSFYGAKGVLEAFWRTLLADQWEIGQRLNIGTARPLVVPPTTLDEHRALCTVSSLIEHLHFLRGRMLILLNDGRFGLASSELVAAGDLVIVAPGGAVPYLVSGFYIQDGIYSDW